ncbi:TonB-dependent siderophore receptor [Xanthobacter pseudotagetidis]|uniref:TonB-dependent siderophore receptor n=1 Tax=Xanthobacter pseudotagetidis TaxID=3119911 RepID=UPI003728F737
MILNKCTVVDTVTLAAVLVGSSVITAEAQQANGAVDLPTVEVVNDQASRQQPGDRATPWSAGPVIDYVATDSRVGTKTDTPLIETPQSITVVGDEQMRDQGVQSLQEAVRYTAGVFADGFGLDSRGDYAIIRGIPASYFIDGLRSSFGYYSNTAAIEPYALERVEVLRGPASMLYGQSSLGGIINGVSKLPLATPRNEITFEYGSFDFKQIKFDTSGPLTADGKWLYRVVGLGRDAGTQVDFVDNDRLMLAPSITYRPTDMTSITLLANFREDHSGSVQQFLPQIGTLVPNRFGQRADFSTFVGEPSDKYDTSSQSGTFLFDHEFENGLKLRNATRYTHVDNTYNSTYAAVLTPARIATLNALLGGPVLNPAYAPFLNYGQSEIARAVVDQQTETGVFNSDTNLTGNFTTGPVEHKVIGGFDYTQYVVNMATSGTLLDNVFPGIPGFLPAQPRFNMYRPVYNQRSYLVGLDGSLVFGQPPLYDRPQETQKQTGLYIQDQMRMGPWIAVLGLRQDWLTIEQEGAADENLSATSTRAALMYETDFGFAPYVSFSTAFEPQPGQPVARNITAPFNTQTPAKPLEGNQVEIGFKYKHPTLPLVVNAAVYDLTQDNVIVQPDFLFNAVQGASINVRGFEIEAIGEITPNIKIVASYSYTDAKYESYPELYPFPSGIPAFMKGKPVDGIPQNLASLWGVYTVKEGQLSGLSFGGGVRYIGEAQSYGRDILTQSVIYVETPAVTLFDAMVAYETKNWRFQVTGQNLANTFYVASCSAYRGDCGVGQARTVIGSATYKF